MHMSVVVCFEWFSICCLLICCITEFSTLKREKCAAEIPYTRHRSERPKNVGGVGCVMYMNIKEEQCEPIVVCAYFSAVITKGE